MSGLPEEIWQRVASYMRAQDWARASGTCKTTWKLELQSVKIMACDGLGVLGRHSVPSNDTLLPACVSILLPV